MWWEVRALCFFQGVDPSVMKICLVANNDGLRDGIRSVGDGETVERPGIWVQCVRTEPFLDEVASGPRSSPKDPNAQVAIMQRDAVRFAVVRCLF